MRKKFDARAHILGHNISMDKIISSRYALLKEPAELAQHLFEELEGGIPHPLERGCVIVAGKNFGCGAVREQAVIALKAADMACIIASSFSRSFYRSAINQGIPLIEQESAYTVIDEGEIITIDFEKSEIICKDDILKFKVIPEVVVKILSSGGLIPLTKKSLGK